MVMRVDTHQHFWNLDLVEYSWLIPAYGPLYRTYGPHELEPQLTSAGIDKTVLVQSANSYADSNYMLAQADKFDWIGAVIGWVPLWNPREAAHMLDTKYSKHPKFRGMRHQIHEEQDPEWLLWDLVVEGLKLLEERDLVFEIVAVFPNHLSLVPALAKKVPNLTLVIDHMAKPPIKDRVMGDWAEQFAAAAEHPNVHVKVSGLNTAADWEKWTAADIKPYIDFAREKFGAGRMMFGSDWPVAVLAGDYQKVWDATQEAIGDYSQKEQQAILGETAVKVYGL
jgi:L-fuconolactonase